MIQQWMTKRLTRSLSLLVLLALLALAMPVPAHIEEPIRADLWVADDTARAMVLPGSTLSGQEYESVGGQIAPFQVSVLGNGTVIIHKETKPGGATGFEFLQDIDETGSFSLDDGQNKTFEHVVAGQYTVTEHGPPHGPGPYVLTGLVCEDSDPHGTPSTTDLESRTATVNLDPGETVTCTYTNAELGTVVIEKETTAGSGRGFQFSQNVDQSGDFHLDGGQSITHYHVLPGQYTVTEHDPTVTPGGYDLRGLVCLDSDPQGKASTTDLEKRTATINLDPGETVTCTFKNERLYAHQVFLPIVAQHWGPAVGWAVGDSVDGYGTIIHTTDGGETWVRQGKAGEIPDVDLERVSAIDAQNAWVAGDGGTILRTRDGGRTWQLQEVPDDVADATLFGIYAVDGDTAWAAGNPSVILHTTDGGRNWLRKGHGTVPPNLHLEGVYASDADHAWAAGGGAAADPGGYILRTTDGGAHWDLWAGTEIDALNDHYMIDIHGVDARTVWASGNDLLVHTADAGLNWVAQYPGATDDLPGGLGGDYNGVFAVDRNTLWTVVDPACIYRSDNGGNKWDQQRYPVDGRYMRISAVDKQSAWIGTTERFPGEQSHVLHTADGGQTWRIQKTPVHPIGFGGISFVR